jgi:hypothetical protein
MNDLFSNPLWRSNPLMQREFYETGIHSTVCNTVRFFAD